MHRLSALIPLICTLLLSILLFVVPSTRAQDDKDWADSLYALSLSGHHEPSLQQIFDSLGYDIDVASDELGLEVFCARPGVNTVHLVVEYARSAHRAESGYYLAGDPSSRVRLFRRWDKPGDSAQFNFDGGQIGFYFEPNTSFDRDIIWYTETRFNRDHFDHAKVFSTGNPGEYLIAFEDIYGGGDEDFQDLVLRAQLGAVPTCHVPNDTTITQCTPTEVSIPIGDANCTQVSGPGTIQNGNWTYTPSGNETVSVGLSCADQCGVYCESSFDVTFKIRAGTVDRLEIDPAGDISATAGDTIVFTVTAYDCTGSQIPAVVHLEFAPGSDSIGTIGASRLIVTTVGSARVIASSSRVSVSSGLITVKPGPLASMELQIYPTQLVGHPLIHSAALYLFDAFGNPKTDYDLATAPISLTTSQGKLSPSSFAQPSLLVDGSLDLLGAGIIYSGESGTATITAGNGTIASDPVTVSFNKYDIAALLDAGGNAIDRVYSDASTLIRPVVINNGDVGGSPGSRITVHLASQTAEGHASFSPANPGTEDTLTVNLPPAGTQSSFDTLITIVETDFHINGASYTVADTARTPVTVTSSSPTANWSIVPGSFKPDTVFIGLTAYVDFQVLANGAGDLIDSSNLKISILRDQSDPNPLVLFDGFIPAIQVNNGTAVYAGIPGRIPDSAQLETGWYPVRVELVGFSNGQSFTLDNEYPDSLHIFQMITVNPVPESLTPSMVSPGVETPYHFKLEVVSEVPFPVAPTGRTFLVVSDSDPYFRINGNLVDVPDTLMEGTYDIQTDPVVLPSLLLGDSVRIGITIRYAVPGNRFFGGLHGYLSPKVFVTNQPVVKIVGLAAEAPNKPFVNTDQQFTLSAKIANVSAIDANNVGLVLSSDGQSNFVGNQSIAGIPAGDTTTVIFPITAPPSPEALETFTLQLADGDYMVALPDDNSASIVVQSPADLTLDWHLFGVSNGEVSARQPFSLTVRLKNAGQGSVGDALYVLTTPGQLFGTDATVSGVMSEDDVLSFDFMAPSLDTSGTFSFTLTQRPEELNTLVPAKIDDTTFTYDIKVTRLAGGLVVEPTILQKDLVGKNMTADLFSLSMSNTSNVTDITVTQISLEFSGEQGGPITLSDLLDENETAFLEDGGPIGTATLSGNQLILTLSGMTIAPTQTRRIVFQAGITGSSISGFTVALDRDNIGAYFSEGSSIGDRAPIISSITDQLLVNESYTIRGGTLSESFVIKDNPFDPTENPAVFSYALSRASGVEFEIFSLIGERVYRHDIPAGQSGTSAGRHTLEWNGLNDEGRQVLNGVYIACLRAVALGEEAKIKVAVVK